MVTPQPCFILYCSFLKKFYVCVCVCVCARARACMHIQSCPTLCDPVNHSLLGFSVCGVFQARILEWGDISYSRGSSGPKDRTCVSCISRTGKQILYTESPVKLPLRPQLFTNLSYMITLLKTVPKWPSTILATQD